jgi:glyoxylase-like metal-dependent hydrolase (beta-lactamase superfamily II)/ferredoxin
MMVAVARLDLENPANCRGDWFVDTRCIDCDACRQVAPDLFADRDGRSIVAAQPADPDAERSAWRAALACPTQSIGNRHVHLRAPAGLFPQHLAGGVHFCGYNSEDSFGANAFLAVRPEGNLLVDCPRWTGRLAEPIAALGGVGHILLTHRDDVADADRWADRFGARVWIHEDDAGAAPFATDVFDGTADTVIRPGLVATPVPGHTRGSVVFTLDERFLFTGDSLFWDAARGDLAAHRWATWYSWSAQAESLARLADRHDFEWVLAGHGGRGRRPPAEMHARLVRLADRMASAC